MRLLALFCSLSLAFSAFCTAATENVVWSGKVSSSGTPTHSVELTLGQTYRLKVSQIVNLGKWRQNRQPLAEDACYEFFANASENAEAPTHFSYFRNSMGISVCDGKFHPDHIYQSEPFMASQNGIHFWVWDTDYTNNSGDFYVEVIHMTE